jgi:predicted metal-binding protein
MFGCGEYGHGGTCPPNTPPVSECERFFKECVDVYSTVRRIGYEIRVLTDYDQKMNRYAFLMVS